MAHIVVDYKLNKYFCIIHYINIQLIYRRPKSRCGKVYETNMNKLINIFA